MNLEQILCHIRAKYMDIDIINLVEDMESGKLQVRKQLSDLICREPAGRMSPLMIYEISKWGINDDLSLCSEIRTLDK